MPGDVRELERAASRPLARSAAFAAVAVPVSLVGHAAAGGAVPRGTAALVAVLLTGWVHRVVLSRRERSWAGLGLALLAAQTGLHLMFAAGGPGAVAAGGAHRHGVHAHAAVVGDATAAAQPGPAWLPMVCAHVAAAAVLAWFLRQGERVLWSAARRAVRGAAGLARCARSALLTALASALMPAALLAHLLPAADPARTQAPPERLAALRRRLLTTGGRLRRGPPPLSGAHALT